MWAASPISTRLPLHQRRAGDAREIEPGRAAQMFGVGHQGVAAEVFGEQPLAGGDRLRPGSSRRSRARPRSSRRALDDEGRGVGVELVGVGPDPAVRRSPRRRTGRRRRSGGCPTRCICWSAPRRRRRTSRGRRTRTRLLAPSAATIRSALSVGRIATSVSKLQVDAELAGPVLQDGQQALPRDADEAVAAGADGLAVDVDVDVVPVGESSRRCRPALSGSARVRFSSVWSENTTPQPKVSSARLRSQHPRPERFGSRSLARMETYSPAGPPPITSMEPMLFMTETLDVNFLDGKA